MKIAVLSSRFPYPLEKGDKLRLYHQIRHLSQRHEIHLISVSSGEVRDEHYKELDSICESVNIYRFSRMKALFNCFLGILKGIPFQTSYFYHKSISKKLVKQLDKSQIDVVYCQLARMSPYCKPLNKPAVLDYMDAFGESMARRSKIVGFPLSLIYAIEAGLMKSYEAKIYDEFEGHTIITEQDRKVLNIDNKVSIIANGIDTQFFSGMDNLERLYDIGFVGNMSYPPNVSAAKYLAKNILPSLVRINPDIQIQISGAKPSKHVLTLANKNVQISGWVDDIRDAYNSMKVFIAPIDAGTGQQNKILEAMAMGVPVITNEKVNKGIGATDNIEILIANTPKEYVDQYQRLVTDQALYKSLSNRARSFVEENYTWASSVDKLEEVLKDAVFR